MQNIYRQPTVVAINLLQIKKHEANKTKLLRKASKTFMLTSILIMILSGIALYVYTNYLLQNEIEEELYSNKARVERILAKEGQFVDFESILQVKEVSSEVPEQLKDTLIYDPSQDEIELFRQLSGTKEINGKFYKITVRDMLIETEDILMAILFTFIAIIFLAFIFLFYLNKSRNEKLWQPFFINLEKIKNFSLSSNQPLNFEDSEILEFHELNQEMQILTTKIQKDYRNLKQFTEDVSHEIQTPLAIIQAKIDTLINDESINERQFSQFSSLQTDIARLKQLNKKLILLAKIDNNQFTSTETVSINKIFKELVESFKEIASMDIEIEEQGILETQIDRTLANVLCNNLLSNAVKHTIDGYPVIIKVSKASVQILNAGTKALDEPNRVFDRFYKESKLKDSTGLGLSIVKKICEYYGFIPSYSFEFPMKPSQTNINEDFKQLGCHVFEIKFFYN